MRKGIKLLDEVLGAGMTARKVSTVKVRYDLSLNRGDKVQTGQVTTFTIGQRRVIAGLEYGVEGMRVGGRRSIRVSPHLAYRDAGVPGVIPGNAALVLDMEVLAISE